MKEGIILIDKEIGMTSRSVDNDIQRLFHIKKVGHLGTLDPFASGLLIVAIGKGCKALPFMSDEQKTYIATLKLGIKTDSGDLTGFVKESKEITPFTEKDILTVFDSLLGESEQLPPMTSAVHVNGVKLYKLAHHGQEVDRPTRSIFVHELKLISYDKENITFEVTCSKGTYVRTLGEEIASRLNNLGHLTSLRRIKISDVFNISESKKINEITEDDIFDVSRLILLPHIEVKDEKMLMDIYNGKTILLDSNEKMVLMVKKEKSEDIALAVYNHIEGNLYKPKRGLF